MAIKEKIFIPTETVSDEFVIVVKIHVNSGSKVDAGTLLCEIETSKSIMEVESPTSGYVEMKCEERQKIKVGECLAIIHDTADFTAADAPAEEEAGPPPGGTLFTEKALALMKAYDLPRTLFADRDFVRESEVLQHLGAGKRIPRSEARGAVFRDKIPSNTTPVSISPGKLTEIANLSQNQNLITSCFAVKVRLPETFSAGDRRGPFKSVKSQITPIILHALSPLLIEFRELNAFFHEGYVHYYNTVNVGYVLDLNKGIKVVNLGDLTDRPVGEIAKSLVGYVKKYMQDKITPAEMHGSTFTVSDVSSEDVYSFSPLINRYQGAILGISSVDPLDSAFLLNLVFDHRLTEGKRAAQFLAMLKKSILKYLDAAGQ